MTLRLATIEDLESICKLNTKIMEQINQACDDDLVTNYAETEMGKNDFKEAIVEKADCFFVAEIDGELVGYTNGGLKEFAHRVSKYFEVKNLGVIPSQRRTGLGSRLLKRITAWAKEHGYQKIYIESYFKNTPAINFYKKHGYHEIDISLEKTI